MDGPLTARGYWVERAGSGALRERRLPAAGPGDVVIDAICSGVSCGTERLVGRGQVPAACAETMACPGMQGSFALPILYA